VGDTDAQDATWDLRRWPDDAYVQDYSDFFAKYSFHDQWRDHKAHGLYSDGSTSQDGDSYGAWLVHNTVDTYHGGPLHSDIMVDGILVRYLSFIPTALSL
jgi:rhamnogalacturonan endolyase